MSKPKEFKDIECDDIKEFCPWEGASVACYGGNPVMCEGYYCKEAYEGYLENFEEDNDPGVYLNWNGEPLPITSATIVLGENKYLDARLKECKSEGELRLRHDSIKILSKDCGVGNIIAVRC